MLGDYRILREGGGDAGAAVLAIIEDESIVETQLQDARLPSQLSLANGSKVGWDLYQARHGGEETISSLLSI